MNSASAATTRRRSGTRRSSMPFGTNGLGSAGNVRQRVRRHGRARQHDRLLPAARTSVASTARCMVAAAEDGTDGRHGRPLHRRSYRLRRRPVRRRRSPTRRPTRRRSAAQSAPADAIRRRRSTRPATSAARGTSASSSSWLLRRRASFQTLQGRHVLDQRGDPVRPVAKFTSATTAASYTITRRWRRARHDVDQTSRSTYQYNLSKRTALYTHGRAV